MFNLKNIMIALKVIKILGYDVLKAISDISTFKGLEHRMELVGTYKDITFFNDTIATIPEATINACKTIDNLDTLIFGGQDRGIDYTDFAVDLENSNLSVIIGTKTTGHKIIDMMVENGTKKTLVKAENLEEAISKQNAATSRSFGKRSKMKKVSSLTNRTARNAYNKLEQL